MKKIFLFIIFSFLNAQISSSGSIETRIGENKSGFYYNETLINYNLEYGNFYNWLQFEFSDPPEMGRSLNKMRKLQIEYKTDYLSLKFGDLFEIWGRGLVLNSVDDQALDRDTGIRGLNFSYSRNSFTMQFISGKSSIEQTTIYASGFNNRKHNYTTDHSLYGLDLLYSFGSHKIGTSFLQSKEDHPTFNDTLNIKNQLISGRYSKSGALYDLYIEYVKNSSFEFNQENYYDESSGHYKDHKDGRAFYGNLNVYLDLFSINMEYINYQFGALDPFSRWNIVSNYGLFQPYQNPPTAMNVNQNVLMNRISHQTDFNNEVGYKIEVMSMLTDWIDFYGLHSTSSKSSTWLLDPETFTWYAGDESVLNSGGTILPLSDVSAFPFRETYGELTFYLMDGTMHLKVGAGDSYDVTDLSNNVNTDSSRNTRHLETYGQTFPLDFSYLFSNGYSIGLKIETQFLKKGTSELETLNGVTVIDTFYSSLYDDQNDNGFADNDEYLDFETNRYISISVGKSPYWSATLTIDQTNASEPGVDEAGYLNPLEELLDLNQSKNWANLEVIYNVNTSTRLSMMYGSLKGGLICANGVCRIIEPFDDGFKLGLSVIF